MMTTPKADLSLPSVETLTHSLLIEQAAKWLAKKGCAVVITDMTHGGPETADAIGWRGKWSILIECKTSRSDFRADAQKSFRREPGIGMGNQRYMCAMRGLLRHDDLPAGWGILEWDGKRLMVGKEAEHSQAVLPAGGAREEVSLLLSALRRVARTAPTGVSVRCYTIDSKCRATMGLEPEETTV